MDENKLAKEKALADALKMIEKAYGKGSVMKLGERPHVSVDVIPSGSILLDQALGVGGRLSKRPYRRDLRSRVFW